MANLMLAYITHFRIGRRQ